MIDFLSSVRVFTVNLVPVTYEQCGGSGPVCRISMFLGLLDPDP